MANRLAKVMVAIMITSVSYTHLAATNADSSAFETTALALQLQDKALAFSGKTYPSRHNFSLWSALNLVEGNKSSVREIIGNHVAAYVSVCYLSLIHI